ncbi:MAG: DUF1127 domain-containing protein [Lysobacterales bacterium]|nr:MAG: DUF1127 domain-containing protein [Xanthomonadales bacterium]
MVMSNFHVQALHGPFLRTSVGNPIKRLFAAMVLWQQRDELHQHLLTMDERLLEDIGFSRAKARQEAAKPVWKN